MRPNIARSGNSHYPKPHSLSIVSTCQYCTVRILPEARCRICFVLFCFVDLTKTIVELTPEERQDPCVAFALKLSSACILNNYKVFFKLYREAPRMASYLIDLFVPRMRKAAVISMIKACVFYVLVVINRLIVVKYRARVALPFLSSPLLSSPPHLAAARHISLLGLLRYLVC